jgi:aminopeptidase-like protein
MRIMLHLLSYADGEKDLIEIADIIDVSITELSPLCCLLQEAGLLDLNYKLF